MKRFVILILGLSLTGCMHYATPHGQDITIKNIDKLPVKVGLLVPLSLSKDSIWVDIGGQWNWIHFIVLQSGAAMSEAIHKALSASVSEVVTIDSLRAFDTSSMSFLIEPEIVRNDVVLWPTTWSFFKNYGTSTVETDLRFNLIGKNNIIIDSIFISAKGVSGRILDSSDVIDSVIADAADSAISSLQDQTVYALTHTTKIRSYLALPNPTNDIAVTTPATHGIYGTESQFELDPISHSLKPIPPARRWSMWDIVGTNFNDDPYQNDISLGFDLLFRSGFSFRLGISILNYFKRQFEYYSFTESKFIAPNPEQTVNWGLLTQASYLFFGPRLFIEAGVGLSTIFGKGFTGIITIPDMQRFQPSFILGLRHQSVPSGICFGATYTPYFDQTGFHHHMSLSFGSSL